MRLIGFLTAPFSIRDALTHLEEPTRPPEVPPWGPPELMFAFEVDPRDEIDQMPAIDPTKPEPVPIYERDQTRSW